MITTNDSGFAVGSKNSKLNIQTKPYENSLVHLEVL